MPDIGSVTHLLMQLHSPDPATRDRAISELVSRFTPELLDLIAGRMNQRLQARVAPEDILQEVLLSFCNRQRRGEYDLANRDQFLDLIVTISLHKVCSAARREQRQRRDVRREQSLASLSPTDQSSPDFADPRTTPPDVVAEIAEEIERLLAGLPTECREVALLRLEGYTTEEIARKVDRTPRTVERRLERVRELWGEGMSEG
jgi:RNA polymerase sigma factor (sigma-70 family)